MRIRATSFEGHAGPRAKRPDFGYVRWLAVLLPALSVGLFEFLRHQWLASVLPEWLGNGRLGNVAGAFVVAVVVNLFVRFFTGVLQESLYMVVAW